MSGGSFFFQLDWSGFGGLRWSGVHQLSPDHHRKGSCDLIESPATLLLNGADFLGMAHETYESTA